MKVGFGQDTHAFEEKLGKPLLLGGILFKGEPGLKANSDGDLVLHAICRALDSLVGKNYLGKFSDKLCLKEGIKDSREYLKPGLKALKEKRLAISSVSIALECKKPKISPKIEEMRKSIAGILGIEKEKIGITAETGEGLSDFAKGKGIRAYAVIAAQKRK